MDNIACYPNNTQLPKPEFVGPPNDPTAVKVIGQATCNALQGDNVTQRAVTTTI